MIVIRNRYFLIATLLFVAHFFSQSVSAEKLCVKRRQRVRNDKVAMGQKIIRVRESCPRRWVELLDTETFRGIAGSDGQDAPSVYGDGSAGDVTISADTNWTARENFQFQNLVIEAGQELIVASGTVIRCTGSFRNEGAITVATGGGGGRRNSAPPEVLDNGAKMPHAGIVQRGAANASYGTNAQTVPGGEGGDAQGMLLRAVFSSKLYQGPFPAGAGGATAAQGSDAGGAVYILCQGEVENDGLIAANGGEAGGLGFGTGGGAGGYIVLASSTSVINSSNILATGGAGGASSTSVGAGGGGGGGVIILIAPSIVQDGVEDVSGGAAGSTATAVTVTPRYGGAGGGAFGGSGGDGADVAVANAQSGVTAGSNGLVLTPELDPGSIF